VETPLSYNTEERSVFLYCSFALRLGNADACRSCRRVQFDVPPLAPRKARGNKEGVLGSDVSALGTASNIPPASMAVGGCVVPDALASPPPNPILLAEVALSEAEVEKSV
jgi:hypothetical protein